MKKILSRKVLPIIAIIVMSGCAFADESTPEEVILEHLGEGVEINEPFAKKAEYDTSKTLKEKLSDVYHLEVEHIDRPSYLFENILTKEYSENSLIERTHVWGAFNGYWDYRINESSDNDSLFGFNALNIGIDGDFKNNSADFRIMMGIIPQSHRNMTKNMFSDVYIGTNKIPHHRVMFGHIRPKVGMEGGNSAYTLPFLYRSQIARTYGQARRVGARIIGDYSLIDYEFGGYDSDTYFNSFFSGAEFVGWVNFKPLGLTDGKYGSLKIGGGIDAGHRVDGFCVTGAYIGYDYKNFFANFEWASADGSNGGTSGYQNLNRSTGFYTTVGYRITPKLQIVARYDEFDPDKRIKHNNSREYSLGLNYFIKGQALRLILNYMFCQNDSAKDSHRIMLGTQILL